MVILASFALDILALFASEASAERVFSHCGDLTRGKHNRIHNRIVTLEQSVLESKQEAVSKSRSDTDYSEQIQLVWKHCDDRSRQKLSRNTRLVMYTVTWT